jgi:hypothetical protein
LLGLPPRCSFLKTQQQPKKKKTPFNEPWWKNRIHF